MSYQENDQTPVPQEAESFSEVIEPIEYIFNCVEGFRKTPQGFLQIEQSLSASYAAIDALGQAMPDKDVSRILVEKGVIPKEVGLYEKPDPSDKINTEIGILRQHSFPAIMFDMGVISHEDSFRHSDFGVGDKFNNQRMLSLLEERGAVVDKQTVERDDAPAIINHTIATKFPGVTLELGIQQDRLGDDGEWFDTEYLRAKIAPELYAKRFPHL